eukprot:1159894-Pelagomonas_calceolata.AAC.6
MEESSGSSRAGSSGEGGGRQNFFAEEECMEGAPTLEYVTNCLWPPLKASEDLANDQMVFFEGKVGQDSLRG